MEVSTEKIKKSHAKACRPKESYAGGPDQPSTVADPAPSPTLRLRADQSVTTLSRRVPRPPRSSGGGGQTNRVSRQPRSRSGGAQTNRVPRPPRSNGGGGQTN